MPMFADNDDIFQVIIYIIIAVVGIASSAYKNYNKQKELQRKKEFDSTEEPEYTENPFKPLFDYLPEIEVEENIPEYLDVPVSKLDVVPSNEGIFDIEKVTEEGGSVFEQSQLQLVDDQFMDTSVKITDNDLTNSSEFEMENEEIDLSNFELKQAIIYSEILNSKYI